MKLRNRMIALVCLLLFLGLGAAIFFTTTTRKPFAIILFLSDNINPSSLTAARIFSGGGDAKLLFEDLPNVAICRNAANDYSVPESASVSTAIAAGKRVNRGSLCIDPTGAKLPSLLEIAGTNGRSTGLITSGEITSPSAAVFYAKTINAQDKTELEKQFLNHPPFDFVIASETMTNAVSRSSAPYLKNGSILVHSMSELENQPFWKKTPLMGILPPDQLSLTHPGEGDPATPSLSDLVRVGIKHLQSNRTGYLLVVDDPTIGESASSNDAERMFQRILSLDQAVATARRYAGDKALIVVAGKETIAGPQLNGYPFLGDKGVAILSLNAQGTPSICWSTGPGFGVEQRQDFSTNKRTSPADPGILSQPSAYFLPKGIGIGSDGLTLGVGQGSEKLHGFLDLTDVHHLIFGEL